VDTKSTVPKKGVASAKSKGEAISRVFVNDMDKEKQLDELFGITASDYFHKHGLDPRPAKRPKRYHPVMSGKSKHFYYLLDTKKMMEQEKESTPELPIPVNEKVIQIVKRAEKPFVKMTGKNLVDIRRFLLRDVAPKMLPLISAVEETRDVLAEITKTDVKSTVFSTLLRTISTAAEVKIASFTADYLELNKEEKQRFYERISMDRNNEALSKMQVLGAMQRQREGHRELQVPEIRRNQRNTRKPG